MRNIMVALLSLMFASGCAIPSADFWKNENEYVFSIPDMLVEQTPNRWEFKYHPQEQPFFARTSQGDTIIGFVVLSPRSNIVQGTIVKVFDEDEKMEYNGMWDLMGCDRTIYFPVEVVYHRAVFSMGCAVLPKQLVKREGQRLK